MIPITPIQRIGSGWGLATPLPESGRKRLICLYESRSEVNRRTKTETHAKHRQANGRGHFRGERTEESA